MGTELDPSLPSSDSVSIPAFVSFLFRVSISLVSFFPLSQGLLTLGLKQQLQ